MRSIKGLALRFFKANKFIAFSSIIGVMLSISLIITMGVFAINAEQSLENEFKKVYGDMDLSVGYNLGQNKIIDKKLFHQITADESIDQYSGVLVTKFTVNQLNADIYTVGVENDALVKSKYHFNEDLNANEVILNKALAEALNVQIGDSILIENKPFIVKEVLSDSNAAGLIPDMLILSRATVQEITYEKTGVNNEATYILIKAADNTDIMPLTNEIRAIDSELRIDVAEENEFLQTNLESLNIFMIILSFLLLIVTSLLIISNFEVFLYKYKNQFAIMRSIGATSKQMFKVILIQGSLINVIGAILGLILAIISNQFLLEWFEKLFAFEISVTDFNYKIAIIVMLISMIIIEIFMLFPSYKSAKVLPFKIMRENEQTDFLNKKVSKCSGKILIFSSIFLILLGVAQNSVGILLIAALLLVLAIFRFFPIYLSPILTRILPVIRYIFGNPSYVAIKNLIPQVRKNTFVVLMISTMMIIAVFGSAFLKTLEKNDEQYLQVQYPTNIVVESRVVRSSTIDPFELQASIKDISSVEGVSTLSTANSAELKRGDRYISLNYALADLKEMERQGLLTSIPENVDNIVILTRDYADKYQLEVGDKLELGLYSDEEQRVVSTGTVVVSNIVEKLPGSYFDAYMDWQNITYRTESTRLNKAFVSSDDPTTTLQELEKVKTKYPAQLQINSYEQSLEKSKEMFYQRWAIFIAFIIVMLLSVMVGVFNTLINNIHSKRKEFAVLRTISVDRKGIVKIILTQIILYILIGLIFGIVSGILLTYVLVLIDPTIVSFDFRFILIISLIMINMAFLIFTPFAYKLGGKKIILELTQDNK